MSEEAPESILSKIRQEIKNLEPYRFTRKVIISEDGLGLQMTKEMYQRCVELTGEITCNVKRCDQVHIQVVEELGDKALPLKVKEFSLLPGQRWDLDENNDVYVVWAFD